MIISLKSSIFKEQLIDGRLGWLDQGPHEMKDSITAFSAASDHTCILNTHSLKNTHEEENEMIVVLWTFYRVLRNKIVRQGGISGLQTYLKQIYKCIKLNCQRPEQ